jgi:hypothetical protein
VTQVLADQNVKIEDMYKPVIEVKTREQMMSMSEALEVYMATFDKGKLRHLKEGNGMTDGEIQSVINQIPDNVRAVGDWMLEKYRDGYAAIADVYAAVNDGKVLPNIDGYSRIFLRKDKPWHAKTVDYGDLILKEMDRRGYHKRDVRKGMVEERTQDISPLRLDAFTNYHQATQQAEWYKAMAVPANKVGAIINDKDFQNAVDAKTHGIGSQLMSKWLQDIASERTTLETTWFGHMMNRLRQNAVVASLGFNILSWLRQPLSASIAMADDPRLTTRFAKNLALMAKDRGKMFEFVEGKSDLVKTRSMDRDLRSMARGKDARSVYGAKKLSKVGMSKIAMQGIQVMDRHTVVAVWKAAYDLAIEDGRGESTAVDYADKVVEKTQPMADIMDLPAFFRGSTLEKLFSTFQNQINQNYNYWYGDIYLAGKEGKFKGVKGKELLAWRVLTSYMLPAFMMGLIARGFGAPDEPKEWVQDMSSYGVAPIFMAGSMASGLIQGYGVRMPVGFGMFEELGKAAQAKDVGTAASRVVGAAANAYGLPWSQPKRTLLGIAALGDGETSDARRLVWNEYALAKQQEAGPSGSIGRRRRRRGRRR